jgi:hypothetical protein
MIQRYITFMVTGCKKKDEAITLRDIDGNFYNTVTIGLVFAAN